MSKNENIQLHYEVEPKYIPEILRRDWEIPLSNDEEEVAIHLFQWGFGTNNEHNDIELCEWNMKLDTPFSKGYFNGKLSFTLNKENINIFSVFLDVITYFIKSVNGDNTLLNNVGTLSNILKQVVKINFLKNLERCIFICIIKISKIILILRLQKMRFWIF